VRLLKFVADQAEEQHADCPQVIVAEAIRHLLVNERKFPVALSIKRVREKSEEIGEDMDSEINFTPKLVGQWFAPWSLRPVARQGIRVCCNRSETLRSSLAVPESV